MVKKSLFAEVTPSQAGADQGLGCRAEGTARSVTGVQPKA